MKYPVLNNLKYKPTRSTVVLPSSSSIKEKKAGENTNDLWRRRISQAFHWRRNHWNGDSNWKLAYKIYRGKHWDSMDQNSDALSSDNVNDRITVNITGSTVLNLIPFLFNRKTEFVCKPRKPSEDVQAQIQTEILNYEFTQNDLQPEIKRALYDAVICGHGIVKTGYTLEVDEAAKLKDGEITYHDFIKKDSPYIKRISPFMFLYDPTSSSFDLRGARWCAEIFFSTKADVLANGLYDKSVLNKIADGAYSLTTYEALFGDNVSDNSIGFSNNLKAKDYDVPEDAIVILYEVWDKKFRKVYIFADGCDEPLSEKVWPYEYLLEFPFVRLDFIPIPDEHYPVGIPYFITDQQLELNRIRTTMFQHRRRFNRKYEVVASVNQDERDKLTDSPDGTCVVVPAIGSINPIQDAPIGQDQMIAEQYIKQDIADLTGADALFRGSNLPSRTTAGEVTTRSNLFRLKLDDRVDDVDNWIIRIATQVLKHIQGNYFQQRAVKIVGEQGNYWHDVTSEDIAAQVDVSMESVSAPKSDPQLDRQQALQLLQICLQFMPMIQQGLIKLNLEELLAWVLQKFGQKDIGRFFSRMLTPNAPLQEVPVNPTTSNNLNQGLSVAGLPELNQNPQEVADLKQESGLASILNQSGLQI